MTFSQTPISYNKRRTTSFRWTILLYLIIAAVVGLSNSVGAFLYAVPFLAILFALDYSRRLRWVRFAINEITTDERGITLTYFDKEEFLSAKILWDRFRISKRTTFTRNPTWYITIKNGENKVATFYADDGIDNKKIIDLYKQLTELKTAYA
jgi:hypothetical protein